MTKDWITTEEDLVVTVEKVESFGYELDTISNELSGADIWNVTLKVTLSSGSEHTISDLDEISKFCRHLQDQTIGATFEQKPGTLGYYVVNAMKYHAMVQAKDKLDDG